MRLFLRWITYPLPKVLAFGYVVVLSAGAVCGEVPFAHAQSVIATVNDDPITDYDVQERMKLDKILRRPTTRDAAFEDIVADRLKIGETMKYKIDPTDRDINNALAVTAHDMKIAPQELAAEIQRAGIDPHHWRQHWRAEWMWGAYVRALNRTLDVSETDVRAELAKEGNKGGADDEYTVRQVILTLPRSAGPGEVEARMREATQLRGRFTDCSSGVRLAIGIHDVAVKDPLTRSGSALGAQMRDILNNTPVGHLTPPSRGPEGVEMIAVCSKSTVHDDSQRDAAVRQMLLGQRLDKQSDRLYKEVRARAIIVKR